MAKLIAETKQAANKEIDNGIDREIAIEIEHTQHQTEIDNEIDREIANEIEHTQHETEIDEFEIKRNDNTEQHQIERIVPLFTSDRMKRKEQMEIDSNTKQPNRLANPENESLIEIRLQQNDKFEIERNDNTEQLQIERIVPLFTSDRMKRKKAKSEIEIESPAANPTAENDSKAKLKLK